MTEDTDLEPAAADEAPEATDFDAAAQVIGDLEYADSYFSHWDDLADEEARFVLDGEQWTYDMGHSRNGDEMQVKDLTLLSASRRKWSQIGGAPIHVQCIPQEPGDDYAAERTEWALEREVNSPRRMFKRKRKRAIIGAVVARRWYVHFQWDQNLQEITYQSMGGPQVRKCPGYQDVHDPACPWVVLELTVSVAEARERARQWGKLSEDQIREIKADSDSGTGLQQRDRANSPGVTRLDATNPEGSPATGRRDTVKLLIGMYREDPERQEIEARMEDGEPLPQDQHFMRCYTCGHETQDHPLDASTGELPAVGEACPACAQRAQDDGEAPDEAELPHLEAVRTEDNIDRFPRFPDGRWIECLKESRTIIYDDEWPYQKPAPQPGESTTLRSYPLFEYYIYDDPRHEGGHSDVSWQWNMQALATHMLQWGVDQMRTSGRILIFPQRALVDARGRSITYTNRVDQIAFVRSAQEAASIQEFQPRGLPDGFSELYGQVAGSLRGNMGTGELGLGPDQSRNLPVGTVQAIVESGDIPADDAISMVRESDAEGFGVVADMIQCCWTQAKWVRSRGMDGQLAWDQFSGSDLGGVDVEVIGDPSWDAEQDAKLKRMETWFQMTPPQQQVTARQLGLPPTMVAEYQQRQLEWDQQQAQMAAAAAAAAGGAPGARPGRGNARAGAPTPPALSPGQAPGQLVGA